MGVGTLEGVIYRLRGHMEEGVGDTQEEGEERQSRILTSMGSGRPSVRPPLSVVPLLGQGHERSGVAAGLPERGCLMGSRAAGLSKAEPRSSVGVGWGQGFSERAPVGESWRGHLKPRSDRSAGAPQVLAAQGCGPGSLPRG